MVINLFPADDTIWPLLFKGWIVLSTGQISVQWIVQLVFLTLIPWIVIYPVDSARYPTFEQLGPGSQIVIYSLDS